MCKRYILTGEPREVDKVIRENRIRINRGVISITPVDADEVENADDTICEAIDDIAGDTLNHESADTNTEGESAEAADESAEATDESAEADESETEEPMDDKNIEIEDIKEVDLDIDNKTPAAEDDSKDVQTDDAKETQTAKKTTRRSKKSE